MPAGALAVHGEVALVGDGEGAVGAEPERLRAHAVGAVGPQHHRGPQAPAVDVDDHGRSAIGLDAPHPHPVADVGARLRRALDEEVVEAPSLRHQGDRIGEALLAALPEAQPQQHPVDAVLDDGRDVERQEPDAAHRQPAAAGLVAREALPVEEDDACPGRREPVGRR